MLDRRVPGLLRRPSNRLTVGAPRNPGPINPQQLLVPGPLRQPGAQKIQLGLRTKAKASVDFYVRADGNDANSGQADNEGGAWLTLQGAANWLAKNWDFGQFQPLINVRAGTFSGPTVWAHPWVGGNYPRIVGAGATTILAATGDSQSIVFCTDGAVISVENVAVDDGGFIGVVGLDCSQGGILDYRAITFQELTGGVHIRAFKGGRMNEGSDCAVTGGASAHILLADGSISLSAGKAVSGGLAFTYWVQCQWGGRLDTGGLTLTHTGAGAGAGTTGQKYIRNRFGVMDDAGTVWPGATAGADHRVEGAGVPVTNGALARYTDTSGNALGAASITDDGSNATATGNLSVNGNTTLGNAAGDAVVMNAKSVTKPNAPAFLAYNSASDANATGDGTTVTIDFDTEVYDLGGDFASDTFTAPVTGKYHLCGAVLCQTLLAGHTSGFLSVVTSNRSYRVVQANPQASKDTVNDIWCVNFSVDVDMDAGDTATVTVTIAGSTKTISIHGNAGPFTYFSGHLIG